MSSDLGAGSPPLKKARVEIEPSTANNDSTIQADSVSSSRTWKLFKRDLWVSNLAA